MVLYGAEEIARELGCCREYVGRLAREHGIGRKKGNVWVFTRAEMTRLRKKARPQGRPLKP